MHVELVWIFRKVRRPHPENYKIFCRSYHTALCLHRLKCSVKHSTSLLESRSPCSAPISASHQWDDRLRGQTLGGSNCCILYLGVSQNEGYHFGGPNSKDYNIFCPFWVTPILGNYHFRRSGVFLSTTCQICMLPAAVGVSVNMDPNIDPKIL